MTVHPIPTRTRFRQTYGIVIAVIGLFAIAALVLTRPMGAIAHLSPLSGLITLKASAQTAMAYGEAMANPQPTLIEFYADWCTTCQALAPTLDQIHQQFGESLNFVMIDIDAPQWQQQIQQFQVQGVPHLALVNPDQTVADTFIGKVPQSVLVNRITDLMM
ncbi:MAG: conjugal transfer protein TraF [Leptolyngbya sp. RL_3_1]|nr:conjugal transfer protein TraF [Leptolyngbya sp. RL_3_1]